MRRILSLAVSIFAIFVITCAARAQVVINEIMYRPGSGYPENTGLEFIELHNPTAATVDLSGWAITSGTSFAFPADATIPAGGYKVIAANPALLESTYGISGVLGPWAAGSTLANNGEKIALSKPGAAAGTFIEVDEVHYASEGDWATRVRETTFNGWDWSTPANGGGKSLELRNPALSNDNGQSWAPSTGPLGATPGAPNSALNSNIPPIIENVKHSPAVPKSTDSVTISCNVIDESAPDFLAATLFWRDATSAPPGAFQQLAMSGDSAGRFSAVLAPKANLTIVEFYVSVSDGVSTRTWPAPTSEAQNANCQYQVNNEAITNADAFYFIVLTGAENAAFEAAQSNSDRVFNQTLIVVNGADTTIRYRSGMRIRGNSSRQYQVGGVPFRPLRITIPDDDELDGETTFNLNPRAPHLQFLAQRILQAAGIRATDSIPVELRRNGVELTTSAGNTPDFGKWVRMEDEGRTFVKRHWPEGEDTGNYYKKIDNGGQLNFYWRSSGWTVPANPDTPMDGYAKQNNSGANDWTDLTSFFTAFQAAAAPHFPGSSPTDVAGSNMQRQTGVGNWNGTPFSAAELASVETVADLDQWARWFAVMTIIMSVETNISNGVDDDYGVYFIPTADGRRKMQLIAHDLDTTFGLGDTLSAFNARGLYDMTEEGAGGGPGGGAHGFRTLLPLFGTAATPGNAAFRQKYHDAIRLLYGTVLNADTTGNPNPAAYQFIDSHLTGWVPAATINTIKTWMTQRQGYLLGLIGAGPLTPPAATSSATLTNAPGALMLHEVLANNVAAHLNGTTYPDVIELHNASGAAIDLAGKSLTDDPLLKTKYVFPAGTTIAAGGYLVVYADSATGAPGLHTGFGLDTEGDSIYLYDSVANGQAILDSINFGLQLADFSIGRTGLGLATWTLCTPTIGAANSVVASFGAPGELKINEWAGNGDTLVDEDFIEIYNPTAQPIALGGMSLTDDFVNYPGQFVLAPLSFIAPGAFMAFNAKGNAATEGNATELPFNIDANFGFLALVGQNGTIVDRVDVVAQPEDTSRGRIPDGTDAIATFGLPANVPTPGAPNVDPPANVLALINNLRVSELLYAPSNLEFIELHNIGASTLDLSGVRFTKGLSYTFDAGTMLAAGAYLVVCRDRAAFQMQFGGAVPLAARNFSGSLDNAGETIALQPPTPWNVSILSFAYDPAWFAPETTNGYSLTVIDDVNTTRRDWDEKTTWSPSPALYGTPGTDSPPTITSPLSAMAYIGQSFNYQITATKYPTSYGAAPLPDGLSLNTATGLISGTPSATGNFNVTISATNTGGTSTRTLMLTVALPPPPAIISSGTANGVVDSPFTYQIVATNSPNAYDATGLPSGLSVNTDTGLISGASTQTGTFNVTLSATNAAGTGTKALTLTVTLAALPVITSSGTANGVLGDPFTYQIIATNNPTSYGASGLPAGLTLNAATGLITGAPGATGTFNVSLSATNSGGPGTKSLTLTIASSGPLASFVWSTIPSPQRAGTPFAASLTARDAQGRTVTSLNGNIPVTGQGPGTNAALIVITECGTGNVDYFEIQNVGNIPANTAGWFIVPNNAGGNGGGINASNAVWQLPASIAVGQVIAISENTPGVYPTQIDWNSGFGGNRNGWCMLCDNTGAVRDFVAWGYTSAQISSIALSNVAVGANTYNNITVPTTQWSGNGVSVDGFNVAIKSRIGTSDHNTFADWASGGSEANKGLQNTGMTVPFIAAPLNIPTTPNIAAFTNGFWSGNLTVNRTINSMRLVATDGAAIFVTSNAFTVSTPSAPVITSPANALAVVGGAFSYQILATNFPASFNATGLPSGLSINTANGLITGAPTAADTISVMLSATNLGGTGTLTLMLEVQADSDGDGMGDAWEAANGLNNTVNDAAGDHDGDGQSNLAEWLAGTTANSTTSRFEITSSQIASGSVVLTWSAVRGKRYRVFTCADLSTGTWIEITAAPIVATTTSASFMHSGGAGGGQRFYHVSVEP